MNKQHSDSTWRPFRQANQTNIPADVPERLKGNATPTEVDNNKADKKHFPCQQCGASLLFKPGANALICEYCGFDNPLPEQTDKPIYEYDFSKSLRLLKERQRQIKIGSKIEGHQQNIIHCSSCGADFKLHTNEHSGRCPFCDSPVVKDTQQARPINAESLLPFNIREEQAKEAFKKWLSGLWFAPSGLKQKVSQSEGLAGIYLPYWTYDSQTNTNYRGQRGTVYYQRQYYTTVINGRSVRQVRNVPKVRWKNVSGQVSLFFDDVLIGATHTLPHKILSPLEPWDLHNLKPYSDEYLSGFRSEIYQVELDEGFKQAETLMKRRIEQSIRQDIGGDQQRITQMQMRHHDTRFKHILLPIWSSAFKYQGKVYRFVVNGRSGKVAGERPYSIIKIALAVIAGLALVGSVLYYADSIGVFDNMLESMYQDPYFSPSNPYNRF